MDVILDSNIYLASVSMRSAKFNALFTYLRRTKSPLVVPELVREEVLARYSELIERRTIAAQKAADELNEVAISEKDFIRFTTPAIEQRRIQLLTKLKTPAAGVTTIFFDDPSGIDIREVVRRGVRRIPPANSKGEELRDVILWMVVLHYAKEAKREIAFVTNDSSFFQDEGLREQISRDISENGVRVTVARTLDDFLKVNALESRVLTQAVADDLLQKAQVYERLEATVADEVRISILGLAGTVRKIAVRLISPIFKDGTSYEVGEQAQFVELSYELQLEVDAEYTRRDLRGVFGSNLYGRGFGALATARRPLPRNPFAKLARPIRPVGVTLFHTNDPDRARKLERFATAPDLIEAKSFNVRAEARVSLRVIAGEVKEADIEAAKITDWEELAKSDTSVQL